MGKQITAVVHPILYLVIKDEGSVEIKQIHGTAVAIGKSLFLTAAHSLPEIEKDHFLAIGISLKPGNKLGYVQIKEHEKFDDYDLALVECAVEIPDVVVRNWSLDTASALHDVWSAGFPHSLDIVEMGYVAQRAFKGHIVSHVPFKKLPSGKYLDAYELSFMAPKGISGAPLISTNSSNVNGIIIGMKESGMEVCREVEASDDSKTVEFVYYRQIMYYGLAITSQAISEIHSKKLGMTFKEYLKQQNMLSK